MHPALEVLGPGGDAGVADPIEGSRAVDEVWGRTACGVPNLLLDETDETGISLAAGFAAATSASHDESQVTLIARAGGLMQRSMSGS